MSSISSRTLFFAYRKFATASLVRPRHRPCHCERAQSLGCDLRTQALVLFSEHLLPSILDHMPRNTWSSDLGDEGEADVSSLLGSPLGNRTLPQADHSTFLFCCNLPHRLKIPHLLLRCPKYQCQCELLHCSCQGAEGLELGLPSKESLSLGHQSPGPWFCTGSYLSSISVSWALLGNGSSFTQLFPTCQAIFWVLRT